MGKIADAILGMLDSYESASEKVDAIANDIGDTVQKTRNLKDYTEAVAGKGIYALERIQRGKAALDRLTDSEREKPPGTFELGLETFDFLFGKGDGKDG